MSIKNIMFQGSWIVVLSFLLLACGSSGGRDIESLNESVPSEAPVEDLLKTWHLVGEATSEGCDLPDPYGFTSLAIGTITISEENGCVVGGTGAFAGGSAMTDENETAIGNSTDQGVSDVGGGVSDSSESTYDYQEDCAAGGSIVITSARLDAKEADDCTVEAWEDVDLELNDEGELTGTFRSELKLSEACLDLYGLEDYPELLSGCSYSGAVTATAVDNVITGSSDVCDNLSEGFELDAPEICDDGIDNDCDGDIDLDDSECSSSNNENQTDPNENSSENTNSDDTTETDDENDDEEVDDEEPVDPDPVYDPQADDDGDGLKNYYDLCPNTPAEDWLAVRIKAIVDSSSAYSEDNGCDTLLNDVPLYDSETGEPVLDADDNQQLGSIKKYRARMSTQLTFTNESETSFCHAGAFLLPKVITDTQVIDKFLDILSHAFPAELGSANAYAFRKNWNGIGNLNQAYNADVASEGCEPDHGLVDAGGFVGALGNYERVVCGTLQPKTCN